MNCSNKVWSSFKPLSMQRPAQFAPPRYFAPVPSLMRARLAASRNSIDMWVAFNALPPRFLVFLEKYRDRSSDPAWLKWIIPKMAKAPHAQLVDDWNSSIRGLDRYLRSTKENTSLGFASQCEHDPGSKTGGTTKRRDKRSAINQSLQSVKALTTEHPDLIDPLLKAFKSGCNIADACTNIIAHLGRRGKIRRERHEQEVNIVVVKNVISVLPKHYFSITALYRVMKTAALKNEHVTIVSSVY